MGSQTKHSQNNHSDHSNEHHAASHPFTEHQLILIEMANKHAKFQGHHGHHHHHDHVQYRRPLSLNTNLGLFALKKLNACDPELLSQREKRLLQPVAPGVISHLIYGSLLAATGWYTFYAWKNLGFGFVANKKTVAVLGGLIGATYGSQVVLNYLRELTWSFSRSNLVENYKQKYGEKFLLDVLEPTFRLPQAKDSI